MSFVSLLRAASQLLGTHRPPPTTPNGPLFAELRIPQELVDQFAQQQRDQAALDKHHRSIEARQFWVSVATLVAVIVGTGVAVWNLVEFRKSLDFARGSMIAAQDAALAAKGSAEAAVKQADAAITQADAANVQAAAAVKGNQLTERARVDGIAAYQRDSRAQLRHGNRLVSEPDEKGALTVHFPLSNERPTDATNIAFKALLAVGPPSQGRASVPESDWNRAITPPAVSNVFGYQKGRVINVATTLDPRNLKAYNSGERLYLFTRLQYCDVFKQAHWFHSCASRLKNQPAETFTFCGVDDGQESADVSRNRCDP